MRRQVSARALALLVTCSWSAAAFAQTPDAAPQPSAAPASDPALQPPGQATAAPPPSATPNAPSPPSAAPTTPPPRADLPAPSAAVGPEPAAAAPEAAPRAADPADGAAPTTYAAVATATRSGADSREVSASTSVLDHASIERAPSLTTDSLLRALPSAATFRRSTSLVADPSAQGLNLRGLAPSGVSRSLVLVDGVPANDAFGGWVYWRALPRLGLERIEIVHGGGSALYGSAALGGVVQVLTRSPFASSLDVDASYASLHTIAVGARGAHAFGDFGAALEGEWLRSDGYTIVAPDQRGPIDGPTPSEHGNLQARVAFDADPKLRLGASFGLFREVQNGGTQFTTAEVNLGSLAVDAHFDAASAGRFDLVLFGRRAEFGQVRARIDEDRTSEERASRQEVPTGDEGGGLQWTSPEWHGAGAHTLSLGLDARHIAGESTDHLEPAMPMPDSVVQKTAGGQQWLLGVFAQDLVRVVPALDLQATLRADAYRSFDGERTIERADDSQLSVPSDARSQTTLSPRLGVLVRPTPYLHVRASGYRAFRAPTLNELYRSFQVGTILTAANDRLEAETVLGGELGLELSAKRTIHARLTGFLNLLDRPITNVTLDEPLPDGSARQRMNLGSARVHGLELEAAWQITPDLTLQLGYTWARSEVTDAGAMEMLVGKRLPQDPEHRASAAIVYDDARYVTALLQLRVIGEQFEDDLNTLPMDGYVLVDASLSRRIISDLELFAAVENMLDSEYLVGRAGVDTIGAPFSIRVGVRLRARP